MMPWWKMIHSHQNLLFIQKKKMNNQKLFLILGMKFTKRNLKKECIHYNVLDNKLKLYTEAETLEELKKYLSSSYYVDSVIHKIMNAGDTFNLDEIITECFEKLDKSHEFIAKVQTKIINTKIQKITV